LTSEVDICLRRQCATAETSSSATFTQLIRSLHFHFPSLVAVSFHTLKLRVTEWLVQQVSAGFGLAATTAVIPVAILIAAYPPAPVFDLAHAGHEAARATALKFGGKSATIATEDESVFVFVHAHSRLLSPMIELSRHSNTVSDLDEAHSGILPPRSC
jgi:hypothetical protein